MRKTHINTGLECAAAASKKLRFFPMATTRNVFTLFTIFVFAD